MGRVKITFWGVRGSVATPGEKTIYFGGNTACLEIETGDTTIICDAGTGIIPLGAEIAKCKSGRPVNAYILLSHLHWDHYLGLPFFKPIYGRQNKFVIGGPKPPKMSFGKALSKVIRPPYFPISVSEFPAKVLLKTILKKPFKIGDVCIVPFLVNHPGGAFGWRFNFSNGKSIIHITDNEPDLAKKEKQLVRWMYGADIMIHDAQYSSKNYKGHKGWGHSPFTYPIELAKKANIKKVFLFHFDPSDEDKHLKKVSKEAQKFAGRLRIDCELAREGRCVCL